MLDALGLGNELTQKSPESRLLLAYLMANELAARPRQAIQGAKKAEAIEIAANRGNAWGIDAGVLRSGNERRIEVFEDERVVVERPDRDRHLEQMRPPEGAFRELSQFGHCGDCRPQDL